MPRKKARRKTREEKKVESVEIPVDVPRELYDRLVRDIGREDLKALTPYTLAQMYDIKISLAKKLLRIAEKQKLLKLYSGGRTPIYVKPDTY